MSSRRVFVEDVAETIPRAVCGAVIADGDARMLDTLQPCWHWGRRRLKERRDNQYCTERTREQEEEVKAEDMPLGFADWSNVPKNAG